MPSPFLAIFIIHSHHSDSRNQNVCQIQLNSFIFYLLFLVVWSLSHSDDEEEVLLFLV